MKHLIAFVAFISLAVPAYSQIALPESVPAGRIGEAKSTVAIPDGARAKWKWSVSDPRVDLKVIGDGSHVFYASRDELTCTITLTIAIATEDDLTMEPHTETLVIGKPSPGPDTQPPAPATLRDMVKDDKTAAEIAEYYLDLADALELISSRENFLKAHDTSRKKKLSSLADTAKVFAEIDRRFSVALKEDAWQDSVLSVIAVIVEELSVEEPGPVEPAPDEPTPPTTKIASIQYVYEQREGGPSNEIQSVMDRINREKKIKTTMVDDDAENADGQIPKQYRVAIEESKKIGVPCVVALDTEGRMVKSIKKPTADQMWALAP